MNDLEGDYKAVPELDNYEEEGIDDDEDEDGFINPEARRLAELEIDERHYEK